jgi:hypothetical protein
VGDPPIQMAKKMRADKSKDICQTQDFETDTFTGI